ncbi:hypothetical protein NPIL_417791 [Nephila pilipes]|uniref:Uncharacterized protein n=1 Tax=Nephila pilipes TaxID=299642 RepID=A0A8X6N7X3_NEPPI|nr:hypothetical protein NPIL_417791 [Nephila pilipes]
MNQQFSATAVSKFSLSLLRSKQRPFLLSAAAPFRIAIVASPVRREQAELRNWLWDHNAASTALCVLHGTLKYTLSQILWLPLTCPILLLSHKLCCRKETAGGLTGCL